MKRLLPLLCLFLIGCSTTRVQMDHDAHGAQRIDNPIIAIGQVSDSRKQKPNWLGVMRGGFGNSPKTIETPKPVAEIVRDDFRDELQQRGLLAGPDGAKYRLDVDMLRYECNQDLRSEAHIALKMTVVETKTDRAVFTDQITINDAEETRLTLLKGRFASAEELKTLAEKTLRRAIGDLFSNPKFTKLYSPR